jgi:hypothetical protein
MLIHVHDNLRVGDLKDRFEKCFQSLKIEFYTKQQEKDSPRLFPIDDHTLIGGIRHSHEEGDLVIKSWYPVEQVEEDFRKKFDLHIQIFRLEKGEWVPTKNTSHFNLRQQSEFTRHFDKSGLLELKEQADEYEYL